MGCVAGKRHPASMIVPGHGAPVFHLIDEHIAVFRRPVNGGLEHVTQRCRVLSDVGEGIATPEMHCLAVPYLGPERRPTGLIYWIVD